MPYTFGDDYDDDDGVRYPNASSSTFVYNFYEPSDHDTVEYYDYDPCPLTDEDEDYRHLSSDELYWDGEQWIPNPFEYSPPKYEQLSLELYSIDDLLL